MRIPLDAASEGTEGVSGVQTVRLQRKHIGGQNAGYR